MKRFWNAIKKWWSNVWTMNRTDEAETKLKELLVIEKELDNKLKTLQPIYTSVKTFPGMNAEYYGWVCRLLDSDEYKYMCFDLRENIIREMIGLKDEKDIIRSAGRLDMINVIGNYLTRYKTEYEEKVLRNPKQ